MHEQLRQKIEKLVIAKETTLLQALKIMDESGKRLLLVMDGDRFTSLLSIGDVQRAIIKNYPMETGVGKILRENVRVAHNTQSLEEIKSLMMSYRTECMPVLDESGNLVNAYFWEELFGSGKRRKRSCLDFPVVIMAGGKGTRLKPITNILPKALIPLGNKTILEEIMDRFVHLGCTRFLMSVNYKAEMIRYYFDQLKNPDYHIEYFQEDQPLGTAGSMFLIRDKISTTFFVTNCDIIIEQDYEDIYAYHKQNHNDITLIAALKHLQIPYGTIMTGENGILTSLSEKPELTFKINSGMYILEPGVLKYIPENTHYHITDLIDVVRESGGRVGVFPVSEKSWIDIGEWEEYLKNTRE